MKLVKSKYVLLLWSLTIFLLLLSFGCSKKKDKASLFQPIKEVDFDTSMGQDATEFSLIFSNAEDEQRYAILKELYKENSLNKVVASDTPKIPKIIHQIWVGPKMPPSFFATFQEKWKMLHPGWEYHLWTDSEIDELNLDLRDIIEQ